MVSTRLFCITLFILLLSSIGCSSESSREEPVILGKVAFSNGWARPGAEGQSSAAYVSISNGTASKDSIISLSSNKAEKAEIHESFKGENGIHGMRPAPGQTIQAGENLYLQPGGLHIMLMNLKKDIAEGDSVTITITFDRVGAKTMQIPVKIQN